MSGSAKAGTTAERHTCEAAGSDRLNSARSSEARVRRIFFSLDKDLHGCRQIGLRPESCWNDCLTRRKSIRPCVPSHVAYEVGAARQQTVRSPRTMYPHSQEWHRNREATMHLPASGGEGLCVIKRSEYKTVRKRLQ